MPEERSLAEVRAEASSGETRQFVRRVRRIRQTPLPIPPLADGRVRGRPDSRRLYAASSVAFQDGYSASKRISEVIDRLAGARQNA